MIKSIKLANIATYNEQGIEINGLKEINFFYGANGCGKTTASNFLTDTTVDKFKHCNLTWSNNQPLSTLVYNKSFRERNFGKSDIAGVFTLGEATTEQVEEIKKKKTEQENITNQIKIYTNDHEKKLNEKDTLNNDITEKCWLLYKKYESDFKVVFKGFQKKELFKNQIINFNINDNSNLENPNNHEDLKKRSSIILGDRPVPYPLIKIPDFIFLGELENNPLWQTAIVGKSDIDISTLIEKLGCQDWVNHGRQYMQSNEICPFCQQPTIDDKFRKNIELFFDRSFEDRIKKTNELLLDYENQAGRIINYLSEIETKESLNGNSKLNLDDFSLALKSIESQLTSNIMAMKNKQEKPSAKVEIYSTKETIELIHNLISKANNDISKHNQIVSNYDKERQSFISDVWFFLADEIKNDIVIYNKQEKGISKAIEVLGHKISELTKQQSDKDIELRELSSHTTSVQPAVTEINRLLKAYGFLNFEIVPSQQLSNHYVIQRQNGDLAFESLSEGEVTFITFLYFVQLAYGALTQDAVAQSRVVIIDDPISSLDSNVLFIVSAIVKGLIKEVKEGSSIKQILLFTHNIYFHKEASFQNGRSNGCNKTHYWILRKANNITSIQSFQQKNPINSAYELMWQELKDRRNRSGVSVQNIMRRILENYFKILGKLSDEDIVAKFETNEEQQICLSLLHWINDGSHCIPDDLFIQNIDDQVEIFLRVFKNIFIKSGHISHYVMMMAGEELFDGEGAPVDATNVT